MRTKTVVIALGAAAAFLTGGAAPDEQSKEPVPVLREFEVQARFTDFIPYAGEKEEKVIVIPPIRALEGERIKYRSGGANSLGTLLTGTTAGIPYGLTLQATVNQVAEGKVKVSLAIENKNVSLEDRLTQEQTASLEVVRLLPLGKTAKIILEMDKKGEPKSWLELSVNEAKD